MAAEMSFDAYRSAKQIRKDAFQVDLENTTAYLVQNNESLRCLKCKNIVHNQDLKRNENRNRNYKNENFNNKERYYKEYINNAIKRDYEFNLNFEVV